MPATLARTSMPSRDHEQLQLVTFKIDRHECAIDIEAVREIMRAEAFVPGPASGAVTTTGQVVPLLSLRTLLGLPQQAFDGLTRIIIVEIHSRSIALVVDAMVDIVRVAGEVVDPAPAMTCGIDHNLMSGVARIDNRSLILLHLERLFSLQSGASQRQ